MMARRPFRRYTYKELLEITASNTESVRRKRLAVEEARIRVRNNPRSKARVLLENSQNIGAERRAVARHPAAKRAGDSLYTWQSEALGSWVSAGRRGIVHAATGTGKTRLALAAIQDVRRHDGAVRVFVVVPSIALQVQWVEALADSGVARERSIGLWGGTNRGRANSQTVVSVINSARDRLPIAVEESGSQLTMLVVDECHRAGSPENAKIFGVPPSYTLGLSATPNRSGDLATQEILIPALGPVIYTYNRTKAVEDGIIMPLDLVDVIIPLTPMEDARHVELSDAIQDYRNALVRKYPYLVRGDLVIALNALKTRQRNESGSHDELIDAWQTAVQARRWVLIRATRRHEVVMAAARSFGPTERIVVFHLEIDATERSVEALRQAGYGVSAYHSRMSKRRREKTLNRFRSGAIPWLACALAIDEGLDVPAASGAIVESATYSERQAIQRLGRIVRRGGRPRSLVIRVLAGPEGRRAPIEDESGDPIASRHLRLEWPRDRSLLDDPKQLQRALDRTSPL